MPPGLTRDERLGDILAVGTLAQGVPQEPAVHELRHFGMPPIRRDDGIFSTPYRALWKQSCILTSYGDDPFPIDEGNEIPVLRAGHRTRPATFGEQVYLRASRSGRQDFQARGYGGLHGGVRRATLSLPLSHSVSFSTKAGTREKDHQCCGLTRDLR